MSERILILFGSQSGTAESLAFRLAKQLKKAGRRILYSAMDDYDISQLIHEKTAIFVCSTTGEGDTPDNMKNFWKFLLRKNLPNDILTNLAFTVFGLGDSSYEKFNFPARKLFKRLLQLGATAFHDKGEGDDQHPFGIEGTFQPWLASVFQSLSLSLPSTSTLSEPPTSLYEFIPIGGISSSSSSSSFSSSLFAPTLIDSSKYLFKATITHHERITPLHHFQDVRLLRCSYSEPDVHFNPGDSVGIMPQNDPELITTLIKELGWEEWADQFFFINSKDPDFPLPSYLQHVPISIRLLLQFVVSPFSVPSFTFFESLLPFITSEPHQLKLQFFLTPEGQSELDQYVYRPKRTCIEILNDFPCQLPWNFILDVFPWLRERIYSLANHPPVTSSSSSSSSSSSFFELCIAMVQYTTLGIQSPRLGIATRYFKSKLTTLNHEIRFRRVQGVFQLPSNPSIPILCIAPGTGVAPMRSLLQARFSSSFSTTTTTSSSTTLNYLIFGGRMKSCDFYFQSEWQQRIQENQLIVWSVFSRDSSTSTSSLCLTNGKVTQVCYVQHVLKLHREQVFQLIHELGAYIYIAGRAKIMPKEVYYSIKEIIQEGLNCDELVAETYLLTLKKNGRYQIETWE